MSIKPEAVPTIREIASAVEEFAPVSLQEGYDNCGFQIASGLDAPCTGVMIALDPAPAVIEAARREGCNLVLTHHPLLFRGLKAITGVSPVEQAVIQAVQAGISVYSSHTALDKAPAGVSLMLAEALGLTDLSPLEPEPGCPGCGMGAIGTLPFAESPHSFAARVKAALGCSGLRVSDPGAFGRQVRRVAVCGGSGSSLLPLAVASGADAMVTGDVTYHTFTDFASRIFIVDPGHFATEKLTKNIFKCLIQQKFPNFAHLYEAPEEDPVLFM